MKKVYLVLCFLGTIVPYYYLIQFIMSNGLNFSLLVQQLFANDISTFFAMDFFIACLVFIVFLFKEATRLGMPKAKWVCLATLFTVGLSLALPLFLFLREGALNMADEKPKMENL